MNDYKNVNRVEEARELVEQCEDHAEEMSPADQEFFEDIADKLVRYEDRATVTQPQLFWLRDIRDRYAL